MNRNTAQATEEIEVIAYTINHPRKINPFTLINTLTDLMNFPSRQCILKTNRVDYVLDDKCTFVITTCEDSEEKEHVMYLSSDESGTIKCIGNDLLINWDSEASITKI